jgi:hypothetical protein
LLQVRVDEADEIDAVPQTPSQQGAGEGGEEDDEDGSYSSDEDGIVPPGSAPPRSNLTGLERLGTPEGHPMPFHLPDEAAHRRALDYATSAINVPVEKFDGDDERLAEALQRLKERKIAAARESIEKRRVVEETILRLLAVGGKGGRKKEGVA